MRFIVVATAFLLGACGGEDSLSQYVERNKAGADSDQWIEMFNSGGQWERTGLIFGYLDDYDECRKAIAGLKKINFARKYRCTRAN